jgi:hypothetical protein
MTVMFSVLDNDMKLTPFLIMKREYSGGLPSGIRFKSSKKGWMTEEH